MSSTRIKSLCQLVRLPNVFTAAADSLAGFVIAGGRFHDSIDWIPLAFGSMAIYAAGIALNDRFDVEVDRAERPDRPIPSGRISIQFATRLAIFLFGLGFASTFLVGLNTALVAAGLIIAVISYDVGIRKSVFGPELMGLCRGLNLLLGLSAGSTGVDLFGGLIAIGLTIFITGVTWISRFETEVGRRGPALAGGLLQSIALTLMIGLSGFAVSQEPPLSLPQLEGIVGLGVLGLVSSRIGRATVRAIRAPSPKTLQTAVKVGVLSLIWLDVGVVIAIGGILHGLVIATLWIPASIAARFIYST